MAIYLPELFTTSVRSTAASFVFNATRLVAWVFPIMAGGPIQRLGSYSRVARSFAMIYIIGLIVPWFVPETTGKSLPE